MSYYQDRKESYGKIRELCSGGVNTPEEIALFMRDRYGYSKTSTLRYIEDLARASGYEINKKGIVCIKK